MKENSAEFLVTVSFDTKKQLSRTFRQFLTFDKESLESLSPIPEEILQ